MTIEISKNKVTDAMLLELLEEDVVEPWGDLFLDHKSGSFDRSRQRVLWTENIAVTGRH